MKRTIQERAEIVRSMRREGRTISEIADFLEISVGGVNGIIKRNGIPLTEKTETRTCELCGKLFTAPQYKLKKYCSDACERKASRKRHTGTDETAFEMVQRIGSEWEYAGGYSGSAGFMLIRHKPCGTIVRKSSESIRKGRNVICEHCQEIGRIERKKEEEKRKRIRKELKDFNKPVRKTERISMQVCRVCGGLFFDQKRKYCSDECAKQNEKHRCNMKNRKRELQSRTPESYQITLESVYERDGGICWLCGGLCKFGPDSNADDYPSIEHVIPISRGGMDEWKNVRLAHRICNSLKGAKIIEPNEPIGISPR